MGNKFGRVCLVGYSGEKHVGRYGMCSTKLRMEGKGEIFPLLILLINRIFRSAGLAPCEMSNASGNDFVSPSFWATRWVLRR